MGYGNYSREAHEALIRKRVSAPRQTVFKQQSCHALMNPKGVRARECRDSAEHPTSLGIVFALDVTGSMGSIPDMLARQKLPDFMRTLTECGVVDPQVLFMAVGDATCDGAPLQVGQFETTGELMDQWLTYSYLEGGGGRLGQESYELALYFAAMHTAMDCYEKRKKRGLLFMTGDELPYPSVSKHQVEAIIGDRLDEDIPVEEVIAVLQRSFDPFFLVPNAKRLSAIEDRWRELLGDHVVVMGDAADTCYVAAGLTALREGLVKDLDELGAILAQADAPAAHIGRILGALTPYAATRGRDPADPPKTTGGGLPDGEGSSGMSR